jgi:anhydro-N-acetylmuramic acid kinase
MSGTSADGIDAAILVTDGAHVLQPQAGITTAYDADFKSRLVEIASRKTDESTIAELEDQLTRLHAEAVEGLCHQRNQPLSQIDVIGFHGHTIRHQPDQGITRQIGDGSLLAKMTGRTVVYDFRSQDVSQGGQGAPLAPLYHQAIVGDRPGTHVVLNLGGVGNITWIDGDRIAAGDTGPGCGLLDAWTLQQTGQPFDRDGKLALAGQMDRQLVQSALRQLPYFQKPFPKSADRFDFDDVDVSQLSAEDGAATLCALTVEAVVQSIERLDSRPDHCWVTGGGRRHPLIMQLLGERFAHVAGVSELGHNEDLVEAECFAWLAVRRLRGLPTSVPETTGVSTAVCGGVVVGG